MARMMTIRIKHGIAPCRGMADGFAALDFFLILDEAIPSGQTRVCAEFSPGLSAYFLNRLSNAARASFALLGAAMMPFSGILATVPEGSASRATVTRGAKSSQVLAWSLTAIRAGMGFRHWKRVEESKLTHCLQQ